MDCPRCATENPEGAKFCLNCGTAMAVTCPQCGAMLPPQARFCTECGAPLVPPSRETPPAEPDVLSTRLQRLVPKEYAERLLATQGQVGPERRTVTILFSDVKDSTAMAERLDPEEVLEIMDGPFHTLIEPVYRHEGTLARLMGDAVLAFFGAPIAHEDDPERAIRAALEMTARVRRYAEKLARERGIQGFNVRVGIHTGLVVVGEVGSDLRVEYTAMGDAVNLAARLEQHAPPGGILISHDTYRHVRGVFDVLPQPPLTVKGKSEPVQTYLVQRAKPRPFHKPMRGVEGVETRMVGREAELKYLQDAFQTAREDIELQVVTVAGDAGVGKSRLLHEFDIWAEALPDQYYYFKGRAIHEMRNQPYGLIRDLIAFRFQIQDSDTAAAVREKLEEGVALALGEDENSRAAAHLIGRLLGFEIGDSPHLAGAGDDPQQLRDQALAYLTGYFRCMAAQLPVLILLEDLHWADDSSLDAVNHLELALREQSVMIAGAARPELFERRPHWGEGQPFHMRLELQSLSKWDSRRLVAEILQRVPEVPQVLRDLIVAGAEGNPYFIEELIKMLVEDGVIVKGEEEWRIAPDRLAGLRVPPTLTGVLQTRVDHLPLEERSILQQASVVGRLFWDRAVARINESVEGIDKTEVLDSLSALRSREMVFQRETSAFAGSQEYIFKHNMLREIAYKSVLKRVRRIYHGLVADWLLEQAGERLEEYTTLIADHLELAGRTAEATNYLSQAGDRARALYAHQEAIGAYERALALLKEEADYERAARTQMKLGLTYHTAFDFRQARQAFEEGFALWRRAGEMEPAIPPAAASHALRVDWPNPLTLDPTLADDRFSSAVIEQLLSGLLQRTPENDVVPDVARKWEVLEGGRKYIFHLRDDVRWSDGTPVTAHDFEYAWKRTLDPATGSPTANQLYDVKGARAFHRGEGEYRDVGVRALDRTTLVVELEGPAGYFLQLLAFNGTYPVPRHVVEARGKDWTEVENLVTNGPFRLEAWQREKSMVLVRNPDYHGQFKGNVQQVKLILRQESSPGLPMEMYEADGLDVMDLWALSPTQVDAARQRHAGEYISAPLLATFYAGFDVSRPPFDDPRVRRAFCLAVDREWLADDVVGGAYEPATGGFLPPGMPGHSAGIGMPYNPEGARRLLAEAGYPGGRGFLDVEVLTGDVAPHPRTMLHLQTQWRDNLGVETTGKVLDMGTFLNRQDTERPHVIITGWMADYPDPDSFLRANSTLRRTQWRNEAFDRLVEDARRLADQGARIKLYGQADRILTKEAVVLPLFYGRLHWLVKPWVKKYPTSATKWWFFKDVVLEPH